MRIFLRLWLFVALFSASAAMTSCGKDEVNGPTTNDEDINRWMFEYMKTHYFWNDAVKPLQPNYSLEYEAFLSNVLNDVAAQGDVNHDDGHWDGVKRTSFYSYIDRFKTAAAKKSATRGTHQTTEGLGIHFLAGARFTNNTDLQFVLLAITPGSPASTAGLERGTIISRVDGQKINADNFQSVGTRLMNISSGSLRVTPAKMQNGVLVEKPEITLSVATFNDNPVWMGKTLAATNGEKIGYLCYTTFNLYYDSDLIAAFAQFKSEGIKHLILDLRYNGGGHVVSSTVLGTLITGASKKDQVYAKTIINPDRTKAGERGDVYKIGNASTGNGNYRTIETALSSGVGLNTVYVLCTKNTASASELVVNGLQGLGLTVRLIGATTNGKNVGMEPRTKTKGEYDYEFSPITFYSENAKGFKEYSNGFQPDVVVDEYSYSIEPWSDENDPLMFMALRWINTGTKPVVQVLHQTRNESPILELPMPERALDGMIVLGGEEQ